MADVSPIQLQKALSGLDYPATKNEIVERARQNDSDVADLLERELPDREYDGPNGVSKELSGSLSGS